MKTTKISAVLISALLFTTCSVTSKQQTSKQQTIAPLEGEKSVAKTVVYKDVKTYFGEYKAKNILGDEQITIKKMDNKNDFAQVEHNPKTGEIIGVTFLQFSIFRSTAGKDIIGVYMHACVEGSCNMDASNLKFYDEKWQEITAKVVDISQVKQAFEKGKTTELDLFLAKMPQKKGDSINLVAVNNDQMYEKGLSKEKVIAKLSFDAQTGKFN